MFNHKFAGSQSQTKERAAPDTAEPKAQLYAVLNPTDFAQVYDAMFGRIYNYVSFRIALREEAEDVVGQIFERALVNFTKFDARKGNVEGWLFTIAHNTVVNYYRSRHRHPQSSLPDTLEDAERGLLGERLLQQEELVQLKHNLAKLSDRDRELVALRYGANMSHRDIAVMLKMNENSVAVALSRAISRLRRLFEAEENEQR